MSCDSEGEKRSTLQGHKVNLMLSVLKRRLEEERTVTSFEDVGVK